MWICPNCENEIEHLEYSERCIVFGNAYLPHEHLDGEELRDSINYDHSGTDGGGDRELQCPECNINVRLNELIWSGTPRPTRAETGGRLEFIRGGGVGFTPTREGAEEIIHPDNLAEDRATHEDVIMLCQNKRCGKPITVLDDDTEVPFIECKACGHNNDIRIWRKCRIDELYRLSHG